MRFQKNGKGWNSPDGFNDYIQRELPNRLLEAKREFRAKGWEDAKKILAVLFG